MTGRAQIDGPLVAPEVARTRSLRRWRRWVIAAGLVFLLLPVPWQARTDSSFGWAWRLDGRLLVGDERIDPPGEYSWLTVGRPALVGELVWQAVRSRLDAEAEPLARDLRVGSVSSRPEHVERVAAAVGLQRAGHDVELTVCIEVSRLAIEAPGLPARAVLTHVNGVEVVDRTSWSRAQEVTPSNGRLTFTTVEGTRHEAADHRLPYGRVQIIDVAPPDLDAAVGGYGPPWSWLRSMAMGSSHGLMVGLTTYAASSGEDLASGRHVAGTGRLRGDGTVGTIGGLEAKATAALRAGADVLLVPSAQVRELDGFRSDNMRILAVSTLDDAIDQLRATAGS